MWESTARENEAIHHWERRRLAGNALRINVAANPHSCRRDAGAPSNTQSQIVQSSAAQLYIIFTLILISS
jgi:hypothetical protein